MTTEVAELQQEIGRSGGLHKMVMTSINYNTQLLMIGGWADEPISDIWKFTLTNSSWEFMGDLESPRFEAAGFSVSGLSC